VRVLVVDDDPDTRELVTVILQRGRRGVPGRLDDERCAGRTSGRRRRRERPRDARARRYALLRALHGRGLARGVVTIALTAHAAGGS